MVNTLFSTCLYLFIFDEDILARKLKQASFHSLIHIFEDVFRKKLSKNEIFFVTSPKIIKLCTISECLTKRF